MPPLSPFGKFSPAPRHYTHQHNSEGFSYLRRSTWWHHIITADIKYRSMRQAENAACNLLRQEGRENPPLNFHPLNSQYVFYSFSPCVFNTFQTRSFRISARTIEIDFNRFSIPSILMIGRYNHTLYRAPLWGGVSMIDTRVNFDKNPRGKRTITKQVSKTVSFQKQKRLAKAC